MKVNARAKIGNAVKHANTPSIPLNSRPFTTGVLSPNAVRTAPTKHNNKAKADIGNKRHRKIRQNLVSVFGMSDGNMIIVDVA